MLKYQSRFEGEYLIMHALRFLLLREKRSAYCSGVK